MRALVVILSLFTALIFASPGQVHLEVKMKGKSGEAHWKAASTNLAHARYVCKHGNAKTKKGHCPAIPWLERLSTPGPWSVADPCLRELIDRETAGTWSWTIWNGQGSGAYGWPQALPASKMRSAGPDYMTNPFTQLRWMQGYVNGRYGGSCAALHFHNYHGFY
jgi:hypothetical protein